MDQDLRDGSSHHCLPAQSKPPPPQRLASPPPSTTHDLSKPVNYSTHHGLCSTVKIFYEADNCWDSSEWAHMPCKLFSASARLDYQETILGGYKSPVSFDWVDNGWDLCFPKSDSRSLVIFINSSITIHVFFLCLIGPMGFALPWSLLILRFKLMVEPPRVCAFKGHHQAA